MIYCQTIVDLCNSVLDAEGSQRYIWNRDFKPALTSANNYLVSIFNAAFAANKLSEESLRELTYAKVWQTSLHSRFTFDSKIVGYEIWTILAIYVKITTIPTTNVLAPATNESVYKPLISFRDSNYSCKRLTAEEWAMRNKNPFMAGSSLITCEDLKEYGFTDFTDYTGGYTLVNSKYEIEISPAIPGELIAVRFLAVPTPPSLITDNLQFPPSLTNLMVQLTMRFLSQKQGDDFNYKVSDKEIQQLTQMLS